VLGIRLPSPRVKSRNLMVRNYLSTSFRARKIAWLNTQQAKAQPRSVPGQLPSSYTALRQGDKERTTPRERSESHDFQRIWFMLQR
jgi:hypothetical protein